TLSGITGVIVGSNAKVFADTGNSVVAATGSADTFVSNLNGNALIGGSGTTVDYSGVSAPAIVNLAAGTASASGLAGDRLANINNVIVGSNATVIGGAGSETFTPAGANNVIIGGSGVDTIALSGAQSNYAVTYDPATEVFTVADQRPGAP